MAKLLEVRNLRTTFQTSAGAVRAVDGVSWDVEEGETVALVGESGCGKSVSALSIMRLVAEPAGRIEGGEVIYKGRDLLQITEEQMRGVRGREIGMVFQEPMTSLNPVLTIGRQLTEGLEIHMQMNPAQARARAVELLGLVGIPDAARRLTQYPHHFSGGMRQRMMIAMALACNPALILADEPTTALDVTIQAQILELLNQLKAELGMAVMLITHDLGVVADTAARVAVMYAGRVVEQAPVLELFTNPRHPYTQGLLNSIPRIEKAERRPRLQAIPGMVPDLLDLPRGCKFQARCAKVFDACRGDEPQLKAVGSADHIVRCCLY